MEFEGLPWDYERKWDLGRPKTGLALHHLVTAFSVKKGLMVLTGIELPRSGCASDGVQQAYIGKTPRLPGSAPARITQSARRSDHVPFSCLF
jgi:hypothetical protein